MTQNRKAERKCPAPPCASIGKLRFSVLLGVLLLTGCTTGYAVIAYDDKGTVFEGSAIVTMGGGGPIEVAAGKVSCSGRTQQTLRVKGVIGSEGVFRFSCSDGRAIRGNWVQTSYGGGRGEGLDQHGTPFKIEYNIAPSALHVARSRARQHAASPNKTDDPPTTTSSVAPKEKSSGSGFVVSRDGLVLTNNHVVKRCGKILVGSESEQLAAKVVAQDVRNDLALLKTSSAGNVAATFRRGRGVRAGNSVVVMGFPLRGLLASGANVTVGTVSALAGLRGDTSVPTLTLVSRD